MNASRLASPAASLSRWQRHLLVLALTAAAILILFARDAAGMAAIWWNSSTYSHILFVPPIIAWLLWQRAGQLQALAPRGWWPGLLLVAAGAFGWLLGSAAGVAIARHAGLVLMLQGAVVALLGPTVARGLLFPLCYALFLIPAGEGLVAPLQTLTAKICMLLLGLTQVPAQIEGVFITTPAGWFEVAEACSGAKFLIAMIAYGALVANVCFLRWSRRIAFMTAAIILPVLANGARAWATIYVAQLSSAKAASGFDHIVYGWIFFALVMTLLMAVGWRWFDRRIDGPWFDPEKLIAAHPVPRHVPDPLLVAIGAIALAVTPILWSGAIAAGGRADLPAHLDLPIVPGWTRVPMAGGVAWRPHFGGADHQLIGRYRDAMGHVADLAIAVYGAQGEGRELVGYGQGAVDPAGPWAWTDDRMPPPSGRAFRISAPGPVVREVATFYRVGHVTTGSEMRVKLETLRTRLLGGPQRAVAVLVSAEEPNARPAIDAFLRGLGPIDELADRMAR